MTQGLRKAALKTVSHDKLLRLAKYLGLKHYGEMSAKQLGRLIWWRITRHKRHYE